MKHIQMILASLALALSTLLTPLAAQAQALTDYAENKLVDAVFRGQALGAPATFYVALFTTACSDSAPETEVSGGSRARVRPRRRAERAEARATTEPSRSRRRPRTGDRKSVV